MISSCPGCGRQREIKHPHLMKLNQQCRSCSRCSGWAQKREPLAEWLKGRTVQTEGGCLIWTGAINRGRPYAGRDGKQNTVARCILRELSGSSLSRLSKVSQSCGNKLCVSPEHIVVLEDARNPHERWTHRSIVHCPECGILRDVVRSPYRISGPCKSCSTKLANKRRFLDPTAREAIRLRNFKMWEERRDFILARARQAINDGVRTFVMSHAARKRASQRATLMNKDPLFRARQSTAMSLWYIPKAIRDALPVDDVALLSMPEVRREIIAATASTLSMEIPNEHC